MKDGALPHMLQSFMDNNEKLYAGTFDNLDETDGLIAKHILLKLTREEIEKSEII